MAGHSKWSNIKRRKEAQDNKRGKIFTRLIREVMVAARAGADPGSNASLRLAISRAQQANLNKETLERAIARGSGQLDGDNLERIYYEGYGPAGLAYYVETLTNNRNRTVAEVRHAFSKCGGSLSVSGSVAYLFTQTGVCHIEAPDEDTLLELLIDHDVTHMEESDQGVFTVMCSLESLSPLIEAVQGHPNINIIEHQTPWLADPSPVVMTPEQEAANDKLMEMLQGLDDVQEVYCNLSRDE